MNEPRSVVAQIYHGVPRFVGKLFQATKAPSALLLLQLVGLPLLLIFGMAAFHSTYPLDLFSVGVLQYQVESNPGVLSTTPPHIVNLYQTMTPDQRELGKHVYEAWLLNAFIAAGAMLWFVFRLFRFLSHYRSSKP